MSNRKTLIPSSSLSPDDEAARVFDAPEMAIYGQIITAKMQGFDARPAMRELATHPTEDRYLSRIVAALGFAFGDFESACIKLDLETLPAADLKRIRAALNIRTTQFRLLLQEVFGEKKAADLLTGRIRHSKEQPASLDVGNIPFHNGAPVYYKRDGAPCSYEEWSGLLADRDYARVASTQLPDGTVIETGWLGVDGRSFSFRPRRIDKHLVFYTKVDLPRHGKNKPSSTYFRYATETEAREGHEAVVRKYVHKRRTRKS